MMGWGGGAWGGVKGWAAAGWAAASGGRCSAISVQVQVTVRAPRASAPPTPRPAPPACPRPRSRVLFFAPKLVDAILTGAAVDMASGKLAPAAAAAGGGGGGGGGGAGGAAAAGHHLRALKAAVGAPASTGVRAALLTAVPFVLAAGGAVWLGKRSQEKGERCRHMAVPWFCSAACFILFSYAASHSPQAGFACLTVAVVTATSPNALLNTLASAVSAGPAQAVSLSVYNAGARGRPGGRAGGYAGGLDCRRGSARAAPPPGPRPPTAPPPTAPARRLAPAAPDSRQRRRATGPAAGRLRGAHNGRLHDRDAGVGPHGRGRGVSRLVHAEMGPLRGGAPPLGPGPGASRPTSQLPTGFFAGARPGLGARAGRPARLLSRGRAERRPHAPASSSSSSRAPPRAHRIWPLHACFSRGHPSAQTRLARRLPAVGGLPPTVGSESVRLLLSGTVNKLYRYRQAIYSFCPIPPPDVLLSPWLVAPSDPPQLCLPANPGASRATRPSNPLILSLSGAGPHYS
jgi:hypothetical protein